MRIRVVTGVQGFGTGRLGFNAGPLTKGAAWQIISAYIGSPSGRFVSHFRVPLIDDALAANREIAELRDALAEAIEAC